MKIGKANYDKSSGGRKKFFEVKNGKSVFRILPPLGDLADKGRWSMYYTVHYGHVNSEGRMRLFLSSEVVNRSTKMVEVPDPMMDLIRSKEAEYEAAKKSGDEELQKELKDWLFNYNVKKQHHMNAMNLDGEIGVLKIGHKAKLLLDQRIGELMAQGIDPLGVENGRFFEFERSGKGRDTSYSVSVYYEPQVIGGKKVMAEVESVLDDSILARLSTEAAELDKLYKSLTPEEIGRIAEEGATAVDEIFGMQQAVSQEPQEEPEAEEPNEPEPPAQAAAPSKPVPQPAPVRPATSQPQAAAPSKPALARAAASVPQPARAAATATKAAMPVATKPGTVRTQPLRVGSPAAPKAVSQPPETDEEFLASIGALPGS